MCFFLPCTMGFHPHQTTIWEKIFWLNKKSKQSKKQIQAFLWPLATPHDETSFGANEISGILSEFVVTHPRIYFSIIRWPGDDSIHDLFLACWVKKWPFQTVDHHINYAPICRGIKQCKCMVVLRDFPLILLMGWNPAPPGMYETLQLTQDFWTINRSTLFGLII